MAEPCVGDNQRWSAAWRPLGALVLVYILATLPAVLSGRNGPSEAYDQNQHHLIVVESMAEAWPTVDLVDYPSATSPGYHLVMALVGLAVDPADPGGPRAVLAMRLVNLTLTLGLLVVAWWGAWRLAGPIVATLLLLPLLGNPYFLGGGIFLTTDNAALFFVFLAMTGLLRRDLCVPRGLLLGLAAGAAVATRQIHVWVAAPVAAACLLASPLRRFAPAWMRPERSEPARPAMLAVAIAAGGAPLAVLAWFVWLWGGLMPPAYVDLHNTGVNEATFAFAFAMAGGLGVFLAPAALIERRDLTRPVSLALAGAGLLAATLPATDYALKHRAFGALWRIVELTPAIGGRSLVLVVGAVVGGLVLGALWSAADRRGRGPISALLLLSALGWALAQSFNSMAWQRYFEPFLLVLLAWLVANARPSDAPAQRWRWAGPIALGLIQLGLSIASLYREMTLDG